MKKMLMIAAFVTGVGLTVGALAQTSSASNAANPLITDRWQFRPLILVTADANNPAYLQLRGQLAQSQDQFEDREMLLYTIEGQQGTRRGQSMTRHETQALLGAIDVDPTQGLVTVLVGKDGGKKIEQRGEIDLQQIFNTIDRMPMRQADDS